MPKPTIVQTPPAILRREAAAAYMGIMVTQRARLDMDALCQRHDLYDDA